jgi:hypothetical protein
MTAIFVARTTDDDGEGTTFVLTTAATPEEATVGLTASGYDVKALEALTPEWLIEHYDGMCYLLGI